VIFPCIDLMDGKVVQLVQGREKTLEADSPEEMLRRFAAFPEIQVIDLDAAMGRGSNEELVRMLASKAVVRVGGGVRTVGRAEALVAQGARKVIVGTAAFSPSGAGPMAGSTPEPPSGAGLPACPIDIPFLSSLCDSIGRGRVLIALDSKDGRIVVKGWRESTGLAAEEVLQALEPYCSGFLCTYVDKEGMMQGTDLEWFRRLRAATSLELTAAGGITTLEEVRALQAMNVHAALGMAIYTGRLKLEDLAAM